MRMFSSTCWRTASLLSHSVASRRLATSFSRARSATAAGEVSVRGASFSSAVQMDSSSCTLGSAAPSHSISSGSRCRSTCGTECGASGKTWSW